MTTDVQQRIEALRDIIREAEARRDAADLDLYRARAEFYDLTGDSNGRDYYQALIDAQSGVPGAHDRFMDLDAERYAQTVLAGGACLEDFPVGNRKRIAAAVERLKASQQQDSPAPAVTGTDQPGAA